MAHSGENIRPTEDLIDLRRQRLLGLIERIRSLFGPSLIDGLELDFSTDTTIEQAVEDCEFALRDQLGRSPRQNGETGLLAMDLLALRDEIRTSVYLRQLAAVTNLQRGLAHLRALTSVEVAISRGPQVACESSGFQAAVMVQVDGSSLIPASAWSERDPDWFPKVRRRLVSAEGGPLQLADLPLEREVMRRRLPFLVQDAMNDNRPAQELRRLTGVRSYVVAPILPEDRIIGFMYAIHFDVPLDIVDRDLLGAFTEGYAYALERTILRSRLEEQAQLVGDLVRATQRQFDAIGGAGLKLVEPASQQADKVPRDDPQFARFVSPTSSVHAILSRREVQVMELLAEGTTNRAIAERLIVAEATVKAHVAQILRKLGARNRAEAVTRYLRLLNAPQ